MPWTDSMSQHVDAGALAYVLPESSTSVGGKRFVERHYRTEGCNNVEKWSRGGGPFILTDNKEMSDPVLPQMGCLDYLVADFKLDIEEVSSALWSI